MLSPGARRTAPSGPVGPMALLAAALILGVVFMHSLLLEPVSNSEHDASMNMSSAAVHGDHMQSAMAASDQGDDPMGHGDEGGMSDCSGLLAVCLALLVSFVALIGWRRGASRWVLWQRPPPTSVRLGALRDAFEDMTTRQRTTVIRC